MNQKELLGKIINTAELVIMGWALYRISLADIHSREKIAREKDPDIQAEMLKHNKTHGSLTMGHDLLKIARTRAESKYAEKVIKNAESALQSQHIARGI